MKWNERRRGPAAPDRQTADQYATWFETWGWSLIGTFTFAWRVSHAQANKVWDAFIERIELHVGSRISYLCCAEERPSGCGMPESGLHFHAVLGDAANLNPRRAQELWMELAGRQRHGAGA